MRNILWGRGVEWEPHFVRKDSNDERKRWLLLVAAEAIVLFDLSKQKTSKRTKHKRNNLNIFLVISRHDCKKKRW